MKNSLLAVALGLMTALKAATPIADTEEPMRERKAITALKAACSALGAVDGLCLASLVVYFCSTERDPIMAKVCAALVVCVPCLYTAYKLGWQDLPYYLKQVFAKEHEISATIGSEAPSSGA